MILNHSNTVKIHKFFIEGSWSPAPRQLSHLEYSSKAPKTTEAILSGVIWTENHLFWKLSELKLVNSIWFFPRTLPSGAHVLQRGVDQGERGKAKKAGQGDSNCWQQMYSKISQQDINLLDIIWTNFANVNVSKQPLLLVWEKCFVFEFLWILMFDYR